MTEGVLGNLAPAVETTEVCEVGEEGLSSTPGKDNGKREDADDEDQVENSLHSTASHKLSRRASTNLSRRECSRRRMKRPHSFAGDQKEEIISAMTEDKVQIIPHQFQHNKLLIFKNIPHQNTISSEWTDPILLQELLWSVKSILFFEDLWYIRRSKDRLW